MENKRQKGGGRMVKLKGFVLMESLIAMVIVSFSFGAGGMIYVNVLSSGNEVQRMEADKLIDAMFYTTLSEKKFIDEKYSTEVFDIEKGISDYEGAKGLSVMKVTISDKEGKRISFKKRLIRVDQ